MKTHIHSDHERRGSILLLVVITMSMLSLFAIGATENSRTLVRTASVDRDILEARLGADSAIEYANQRLYRDNDWEGSNDWVDLGNGVEYRAIRHATSVGTDLPAFTVEARSGEATVMLESRPPLKNAPNGTSLIVRFVTASRRSSSRRSANSSSSSRNLGLE